MMNTGLRIAAALVALAAVVNADVRPRVEIRLVPAGMKPAAAGQLYSGEIEISAGAALDIAAPALGGEGWGNFTLSAPATQRLAAGVAVRLPFEGTPTNPDAPLHFTVRIGPWTYERDFFVGPRAFEILEHGRPLIVVPGQAGGPPQPQGQHDGVRPRGGRPLHFTGRIVYTRQDSVIVGVDSILVRVLDSDTIGSETIAEQQTDANGFFAIDVNWDDGGDDPDLYLEVEAATDIVDVEDSGVFEDNYVWSTEDNTIEDFTGDNHDFGTLTPAEAADFPAMHIFNAVTRGHRYIEDFDVDLVHVDAQWPEGGTVSFYDGELHITTNSHWSDWTIVHEYGHHYMEEESVSPSPDYCNGVCDGGGCGHCVWCPENGSVHWTEGVPNWMADAVTRDWDARYGLAALNSVNFEATVTCGTVPDNPLMTEGHVAALLRDIEDDIEDQDGDGNPDVQPACARDDLNLNPAFIFNILRFQQPTTVSQFIVEFRSQFPLFQGPFWRTANNIAAPYTWTESEIPGVVAQLDSPTHPLGAGGNWPRIAFEWEPAPDDASGVTAYSIVFGAAPQEPDMTPELTNAETTWESPVVGLGNYFISFKARDCVGNWSDQWTSFGPFEVRSCNGNGIVDACETNAGCALFPSLCGGANCGLSSDCNGNANPDECDIAAGTSNDCNANGVPDDCEAVDFVEWLGCGSDMQGNPLCTWHQSLWEGGLVPGAGDTVCIADNPGAAALIFNFASGNRTVLSMGTTERFEMAGGTLNVSDTAGFFNTLEMTNGTLTVGNDARMTQLFRWRGGTHDGGGTTFASGPVELSGTGIKVLERDMVLSGETSWSDVGQVWVGDGAVLTNAAGGVFRQSTDALMSWTGPVRGTFENLGVYWKTGGSDLAQILVPFNNHGELRVDAGTLSLAFGGVSSGLFSGASTLRFGSGTHELGPDSEVTVENVEVVSGTVEVEGRFVDNDLLLSGVLNLDSGLHVQSIDTFTQVSGTLRGADTLRANVGTEWRSGVMDEGGLFDASGPLLLTGPGIKQLNRDMISRSSAIWDDVGQFWIGHGAVFTNAANRLFDSRTDAFVSWSALPRGTFQNDGTFRKSAGDAAQRQSVLVPFNNDGLVEVNAGTLSLDFGGAHTGDFSGAGTIRFGGGSHVLETSSAITIRGLVFGGGDTDVHGPVNLPTDGFVTGTSGTANFLPSALVTSIGANLDVAGATLNFQSNEAISVPTLSMSHGTIGGSDDVVTDTMNWSGGIITGPSGATLTVTQQLNLNGVGIKQLSRETINQGAATWTNVGQWWIGGGAVFRNAVGATFDSQTDSFVSWNTLPRGTIQNDGTFRKSAGDPGQRQSVLVPFNNDGMVEVNAGTLSLDFGGTHTGDFTGGGTLALGGGEHMFAPSTHIGVSNLSFRSGLTAAEVHGEVEVANAIAIAGGTTTLHSDAVVTSAGQDWTFTGGTLDCSSGTPLISVDSVTMNGGTLTGTNAIVSDSLLDWTSGIMLAPTPFMGDYFANGTVEFHGTGIKRLEKRMEIRGAATWADGGQLWIGAGGILRVMPGSSFDIQTDASLSWSSLPRGTFENLGTLRKTGEAGLQTCSIDVTNAGAGTVELLSGTLFVNSPATYRQASSGATVLNGGTLRVSTLNPIELDAGSFTGIGTVTGDVNNNAAAVRPGVNGAGTLTISDDYTQAATAALAVEIGGPLPGAQHDVLIVNGAAELAGELEVRLVSGFTPAIGQNFTILTAGMRSGTFATLDQPPMPGAHFEVSYGTTFVTLTVVAGGGGGLPGDLDLDCDVDLTDLATLLRNFGIQSGAQLADGDTDGDGDVDLTDLATLLRNFGAVC